MLFSKRERQIIYNVTLNDSISSKELANKIGITTRTLYADMLMINDQLNSNHIEVKIACKNGICMWEYSNIDHFKLFATEVKQKANKVYPFTLINERVPIIIRKLLITDDYIKSTYFQKLFNISDTTLTKDLNECRDILAKYKLGIEFKPYQGLTISGKTFSRMCAYVDFSDIYMINVNPIFEVDSYKETGLNSKDVSSIYRNISFFCYENMISISDENLLDVTIFTVGLSTFQKKDYEFVLNQLNEESSYLFKYITINSDNIINVNSKLIDRRLQLLFNELNIDVLQLEDIKNHTITLQSKVVQARIWGYYKYKYLRSNLNFLKYLNISNFLTHLIYSQLIQDDEQYNMEFFGTLAMTIYNNIFVIPNEYKRINVGLINPTLKNLSQVYIYRSDLDSANIDFTYLYEHELQQYDTSKLDGLIYLDNTGINCDIDDIPVFHFDLLVQQKEYRTIWERLILKHQEKKVEANDYFLPKYLKSYDSKIYEETYPIQYEIFKAHFKKWSNFLKLIDEDCSKYYFSFSKENKRFVLDVNGEEYQIFNVNLDHDLLSVKQAETLFRKLLNS